jgi:hypothetical protein
MRESENIGKLACRLVETELGEHVLFRDYGLAATDDAEPLSRTAVQSKISQFYPGAMIKEFTIVEADQTGTFNIHIDIEGNEA